MIEKIRKVREQARQEISSAKDSSSLDELRIKYLGRKQGVITNFMKKLPGLSSEEKREAGQKLNFLKNEITQGLLERSIQLEKAKTKSQDLLDISLPGIRPSVGNTHPVNRMISDLSEALVRLGFDILEGPEVESEYYNFSALNIPLEHPSRDVFDTFYVDLPREKQFRRLLRSHTSPMQIRVMEKLKPPLAVAVPGRVYRPEKPDASHSFMFHQMEGFMVDRDIRFSHLKGVLDFLAKHIFGSKSKTRFRPHFFPFTEPSVEVDVSCIICGGKKKTCPVCKGKGWLEILGAGMIHPNVFKAVGYPKGKFTGFAFGLGIERMVMLKYGVQDIRLFFENDLRFLEQV